jgi:hypothetical protein
MAESTTLQRIKERRLDKMRLGQATCEVMPLPSDPEVRIALVPLLESEYMLTLQKAAAKDFPESQAGLTALEEWQRSELLALAIREVENLEKRVFESANELQSTLEVADINNAWDLYLEMVNTQSPAIEQIPEEEFNEIKKVLSEIRMSELSGIQWYALMRFLRSILPNLLTANSLGSSSTSMSILTSENDEFMSNAFGSGDSQSAKSAVSP